MNTDRTPTTSPDAACRFVFGGVLFNVRASSAVAACFRDLPHSEPASANPNTAAASVECTVEEQPDSPPVREAKRPQSDIRWSWLGSDFELTAPGAYARVRPTPSGSASLPTRQFVASATLGSDGRGPASLISAMSSLALCEVGGVLLHAASVVTRAGVVAFVGPSGAGKSTACTLCAPAPEFGVDRLATAPTRSGRWYAFALPGGTRPGLTPSNALALPLAAVLRVIQAQTLRPIAGGRGGGSSALALLRESAFHGNTQRSAQLTLLSSLERLSREIPVGQIYTRLGVSPLAEVERWIEEKS